MANVVTEYELRAAGINPDAVAEHYPGSTEYRGLDGRRCWVIPDVSDVSLRCVQTCFSFTFLGEV
jgi:hypothetical protein